METVDPYNLGRFVAAQDRGGTYRRAVAELRAGRKVSHWIWFVFPQIEGLGFSAMSKEYAISGLDEARAYLAHPVLGPRLRECAGIVAGTAGKTAADIFGGIDAMKLRSSMTLFAAAAPGDEPVSGDKPVSGDETASGDGTASRDETVFSEVLAKYFDGERDEATLTRL